MVRKEKVKIVRLQTLRCEFENMRMKEYDTIEYYYNRIILLVIQMRINGKIQESQRKFFAVLIIMFKIKNGAINLDLNTSQINMNLNCFVRPLKMPMWIA